MAETEQDKAKWVALMEKLEAQQQAAIDDMQDRLIPHIKACLSPPVSPQEET